ncbi:bacterial cell division membrane protein [Sphaerochaeta pleomorpha str. Grapes]|uniref:Probable peptidoglycan glycosyltransferase FtsW n=1 Tax=Sphaerochaeta pleomorpha (strain ATCC BAA-1885 / DSM 22778 / Grapes) TaxID=158190 RepID=G8QXE1_SPHPG|nr:putative peptidoglycan glycosyltransferase FtsW [Sphaerochaeta pleomorpha]AEV28442.1 bacterial cell division membrane protein [Sphaerochaeta pleomorpha str. Grapes]
MDTRSQFDDWGENLKPNAENLLDEGGSGSSFTFLCILVFLTTLGLTMLYSASYNEALIHNLPNDYYFKRQLLFVVLAFVCSLIIRFIPVSWIRTVSYPLLAISLVLMLMTLFSPFGQERLGSRRWLEIGPLPSLQPSELVKVCMILFLSAYFASEKTKKNLFLRMVIPLFITFLFAFLILAQKDYSTTILFLGVCIAMFIASGMKVSHLLLLLAFLGTGGTCVMLLEPYRVKRVASFLFSNIDPNGINYQVTNSLKAIQQGGLFGVGLGNGQYKLGLIPEVQSDFIFASICEETGFLGACLIVILFIMFAILGFKAYARMRSRNLFLSYLAFGTTTLVVLQAIVNISVVTGVLPPTGIPLPFFSQGGTNLFVILCSCALLYRVLLISSGRQPIEKSKSSRKQKQQFVFPQGKELS